MAVDAGRVVMFYQQVNNLENTREARSSIINRIINLLMKVSQNWTIRLEIVHPFRKKLRSPKLHFYRNYFSQIQEAGI